MTLDKGYSILLGKGHSGYQLYPTVGVGYTPQWVLIIPHAWVWVGTHAWVLMVSHAWGMTRGHAWGIFASLIPFGDAFSVLEIDL